MGALGNVVARPWARFLALLVLLALAWAAFVLMVRDVLPWLLERVLWTVAVLLEFAR